MITKLHYSPVGRAGPCLVCGARLDRSARNNWWLRNTWTASPLDYRTSTSEYDEFVPCGQPPGMRVLRFAVPLDMEPEEE